MAFVLGCEKVSVDFPTKKVFEGISLGVENGDRIGIVGRNGDGKSTLLNLLAGRVEPDEGRVLKTRGTTVGLLSQSDELDDDATVHASVVGDLPEYEWASSPKIRDIISGMLEGIPWEGRVGDLSGGQRRRVDLARLLVGDWDVLALDEPTNHLDMRGITWLAQHLKTRWRADQGVLLVVTHDRWFLDEVCLSMWEVFGGRIEPFEGGFSAYVLQRVERDRLAERAEQKRQSQLRRELAWLSRGARARATKPKFHVALAQSLIADVPPLRDTIELRRMAMSRLGKEVVTLKNASVSFPDAAGGPAHEILRDIEWIIGPGDRVGIVGENGAGKTTLLRLITGELEPTSGSVKIGKTVRFAILSQNLDNLRPVEDDRVRTAIGRYSRRLMLDGKEVTPAQLLERLGFTNADLNEFVCDLSGGQRRRLALMLILLDEPNVLILDEPGNDLDTDMLAAVEDLLDGWPGTLVLVTHDRYLMERVTDNQYAIIGTQVRHVPGGVDEYLRIMDDRRLADEFWAGITGTGLAGSGADSRTGEAVFSQQTGKPAGTLSGTQFKALKKQLASAERKMETLKEKIAQTEAAMADADPTDFQALVDFQQQIAAYQEQIEELELEWLDAAEQLGE